MTDSTNQLSETVLGLIPQKYKVYLKAGAVVLMAVFCAAPARVLTTIAHMLWTSIGVALGVGLGMGLALHVYEQLQGWQRTHELEKAPSRQSIQVDTIRPKTVSRQPSNMLEDGSSYASLMALAGYPVDDKVLRGQVVRDTADFWERTYRFTDVKVDKQKGPNLLQQDWPNLPSPVAIELGRFVEHLIRDYVAGWYSKLDEGCVYLDEREKREVGINRDGRVHAPPMSAQHDNPQPTDQLENTTGTLEDGNESDQQSQGGSKVLETNQPRDDANAEKTQHGRRKMVFSTLTHRRAPMLEHTYRTLSAVFGNLATRAEHVNVLSLVLLKWTQVLAHTFRAYRSLRKSAQEKNQGKEPNEVQVTREFLLAGKLHRAVTFGLDVPSLLFADTSGNECGTGSNEPALNPTHVLEQRLFHTSMLHECELDYNRVVAHRLIRALLPRSESSSQVTTSLLVEIFSSCVLQPLMDLWIPSYLNELVVSKMVTKPSEDDAPSNGGSSDCDDTDAGDVTTGTPASNAGKDTSHGVGPGVFEDSLLTSGPPGVETEKHATQAPLRTEHKEGVSLVRQQSESSAASIRATRGTPFAGDSDNLEDAIAIEDNDGFDGGNPALVGGFILRLTSIAVSELRQHVNFEECKKARLSNLENKVDYDDPSCQEAVMRLVLVVEAALLQGRCAVRRQLRSVDETSEKPALAGNNSLTQLLMDMTADMAVFEKRMEDFDNNSLVFEPVDESNDLDFEPDQNEISTVRTLISTWMHTGQLSSAISSIARGMKNVFAPYYTDDAFLAVEKNAATFCRQIELLDGVDLMVETMVVLASPRLDIETEAELLPDELRSDLPTSNTRTGQQRQKLDSVEGTSLVSTDIVSHSFGNVTTARYLAFRKNAAFASSLRSERERRMRSWDSQKVDDLVQPVHWSRGSQNHIDLHQELHSLSRLFYNGTNVMTIRDAARKIDQDETSDQADASLPDPGKVALLTVDMVSNRRRIEVPDDDSSFLLRAQPRSLNAVSIHRDDRNHDLSYKCFLATYEEPAIAPGSSRYAGGRFIRRCFLQYYPIDRTATIMLHNDARKLDRRKGKPYTLEPSTAQPKPIPYLSGAFLKERHLCQKWSPKGLASQTFLSSAVMEATDFNATPRNGKAVDFVYRMSLFDRPTVELAGKRFTVQDSAARGHHRADASALEVSDAGLSALLLLIGRDHAAGGLIDEKTDSTTEAGSDQSEYRHKVEMGPDGYPMLFMKFNRKSQSSSDEISTEIKPYRLSFVRAALLVTSARQEAQLQCLIDCVRAGSAKSATKARTDAQLKPTLKILEYANDRTSARSRASSLLRDLKIGVYHLDREQLRRNGLLNPRHPTSILELTGKVEGAVQAKDVSSFLGNVKTPPAAILYKIRCVAIVNLADADEETENLEAYLLDDGSLADTYREEWVVYRTMKDFQAFHKHMKSQVANAEFSASTGSRLVGAATAAFSNTTYGRKNKKALVPSLAQASKTGAIAVTKRAISKRGEFLDEYLQHLLAPNNSLRNCMELLLFLGAGYPFPSEVRVTQTPTNIVDPLCRAHFIRSVVSKKTNVEADQAGIADTFVRPLRQQRGTSISNGPEESSEALEEADTRTAEDPDDAGMITSVLNKVDQVPLAEVRNRFVELVRYQFGFENASFFRSKMLSALETASFVAVTKASEFRKMLYNTHLQQLNPNAVAGLIRSGLDILWPDGVWLTPRAQLTPSEEAELRAESRKRLDFAFPEQIRAILGNELTRDGLDMLHEMLQNRVVVKSLFYMLFDLVWIEIFPELRDSLPCASALEID